MTLTYIATSLGLIPYFTSRAFVPLFSTAFLARFAPGWELVAEWAGVQLLDSIPAWATSDTCLTVLGILALIEVVSTKSPELRELLLVTDTQLKGLAAFAVVLALAAHAESAPTIHLTEFSFNHLWALGIGAATWFSASLRKGIYWFLMEIDDDDDLGIQKFLSWLEDGIGFLGVLFAVIFPLLALSLTGLTLLALYLVRRWIEHREEKEKVGCRSCAGRIMPCGIHCPHCGEPQQQPRKVGLLGTIKVAAVTDLDSHRLDLIAQKRCRYCGERLRSTGMHQGCEACGTSPFTHARDLDRYIQRLQADLPRTLLVLFILGAVPVVGLIPGVIYYRLTLIAGLRHYIPRSSKFFGRWSVRLINFILLCLQPIPVFGALMLPMMCLSNFLVYRRLLRRVGRAALEVRAAPA